MTGFEKGKIMQNLVTSGKCLILDDDFLDLSLKEIIFSKND